MAIRALISVQVSDATHVAEARRLALALARNAGFADSDQDRLSLVVTELATNLLKHAGHGELIVSAVDGCRSLSVAALALDRGPGFDLAESLRDGYSTAGTLGAGLGAAHRLGSAFDVYSRPGFGAAILVRVWPAASPPPSCPLDIDGISVPMRGEDISGDAWDSRVEHGRVWLIVADGLGHGLAAAEASRAAIDAFHAAPSAGPAELLNCLHPALRHTRGAAVSIAELDLACPFVRYAGIGNISATILGPDRDYNMVSHNGTLGHEVPRVQEFEYPWTRDSTMVFHSDGVSHRWDLRHFPGLLRRDALLIAGVLYRDFRRERDDATVLVVKPNLAPVAL